MASTKLHQVFLSNHLIHALVALHRLGASDEQLEAYYRLYSEKLEPSVPPANRVTLTNWKDLLGKKEYFLDYVEFFSEQITNYSVPIVLRTYLQELFEAVGAAAFHTTIELGYGIASGSDKAIAMGLAYFCYAYHSFGHLPPSDPQRPVGADSGLTASFLDILEGVRQDDRLGDPKIVQKREEGYQKCVFFLADTYSEVLIEHFNKWQPDLGKNHTVTRQCVSTLFNELMKAVVGIYDLTGNKSFFLLHGVTASFALREIFKAIGKDEEKDSEATSQVRLDLFRYFFFMVLYLYIAEGRPSFKIFEERGENERGKSEGKEKESEREKAKWEEIIEKTIQHEDEHLIKLVQVCKEEYDVAMAEGDEKAAQLFYKSAYETWKGNGEW